MTNQKCKGARDFLPADMERFRRIDSVFRSLCLDWGYQEIRTPTIEYLHLFTAAGTLTPNRLNKVYSFLDWDGWSGERVVLRPDGTIPAARLYIENLARQKAARLFYITNIFIFEDAANKDREQWQAGVELLGDNRPTSDTELIMLALEIMNNLGIKDVKLQISHAGVLKALLDQLGLTPEREEQLLNQLREGNWKVLTRLKIDNAHVKHLVSLLLELKGKSSGFIENLKALPEISTDLKAELSNFAEITHLLDTLGCHYQIDITSTTGFEYYTGLCFQFLVGDTRTGSGGRYDGLIPLVGGKKTPACGFALYIDQLMQLIQFDKKKRFEDGILVYGSTTTTQVTRYCFELAKSLREAGYATELNFSSRLPESRWLITVQQKPMPVLIKDRLNDQTIEASTLSNILKILGNSE
jgi:histidyl-tRNA synthetase